MDASCKDFEDKASLGNVLRRSITPSAFQGVERKREASLVLLFKLRDAGIDVSMLCNFIAHYFNHGLDKTNLNQKGAEASDTEDNREEKTQSLTWNRPPYLGDFERKVFGIRY